MGSEMCIRDSPTIQDFLLSAAVPAVKSSHLGWRVIHLWSAFFLRRPSPRARRRLRPSCLLGAAFAQGGREGYADGTCRGRSYRDGRVHITGVLALSQPRAGKQCPQCILGRRDGRRICSSDALAVRRPCAPTSIWERAHPSQIDGDSLVSDAPWFAAGRHSLTAGVLYWSPLWLHKPASLRCEGQDQRVAATTVRFGGDSNQ